MLLQLDSFHLRSGEVGPAIPRGNRLRLTGEPRPLIGHLEKEEKGELLEVVLIRQSVIAQNVAVGPELLDDAVGDVAHALLDLRGFFAFVVVADTERSALNRSR